MESVGYGRGVGSQKVHLILVNVLVNVRWTILAILQISYAMEFGLLGVWALRRAERSGSQSDRRALPAQLETGHDICRSAVGVGFRRLYLM